MYLWDPLFGLGFRLLLLTGKYLSSHFFSFTLALGKMNRTESLSIGLFNLNFEFNDFVHVNRSVSICLIVNWCGKFNVSWNAIPREIMSYGYITKCKLLSTLDHLIFKYDRMEFNRGNLLGTELINMNFQVFFMQSIFTLTFLHV